MSSENLSKLCCYLMGIRYVYYVEDFVHAWFNLYGIFLLEINFSSVSSNFVSNTFNMCMYILLFALN